MAPGGEQSHTDSSEGSDHFSDASEGRDGAAAKSPITSPIPITRVEKVDDEPHHGEVPGTDAYEQRAQDAVPDEVEVVPEGTRSRSHSRASAESTQAMTPGGTAIPRTIVEKIEPDTPSYGDVPGTEAFEKRRADAEPDVIVKAPESRLPIGGEQPQTNLAGTLGAGSVPLTGQGSPTPVIDRSSASEAQLNTNNRAAGTTSTDGSEAEGDDEDEADDDNAFGDDFDDFEEGVNDDEFGEFDDGFEQADGTSEPATVGTSEKHVSTHPTPNIEVADFSEVVDYGDVRNASQKYVEALFKDAVPANDSQSQWPEVKTTFLSERSLSLWSQLAAPPPLQPPNWVRSRIRRLFLVSLGVPVDLDEILPASKQKKLVLPSMHFAGDHSPNLSPQDKANGAVSRVKQQNNSSASVDSTGSKGEKRRRARPQSPRLDINSASILCATTDAALQNFTDEELRSHIKRLQELQERASEVLEHWLRRKDSALGDKEAFEGVIENLVKHAKKVRK